MKESPFLRFSDTWTSKYSTRPVLRIPTESSKMDAASTSAITQLPVKLNLDVRLIIWRVLYEYEPSRLVEIRSVTGCDNHDGPCPRYSPSPRPFVATVCREAMQEALRVARSRGHLLRFANQPDMLIFFNPDVDTLYVPNEKVVGIRSLRPVGVLTQLYDVLATYTEEISLAIEMDTPARATTQGELRDDLERLKNLKELIFVIPAQTLGLVHWFSYLESTLKILRSKANWESQHGINPSIGGLKRLRLAERYRRHLWLRVRKYPRNE
jgi:hypothetical protein